MKMINAVHANSLDNCVTLTASADTGDRVCYFDGDTEEYVTARAETPIWHKLAIRPVEKDGNVYKYGAVIGVATENIAAGDHVHTHCLCSPGMDCDL